MKPGLNSFTAALKLGLMVRKIEKSQKWDEERAKRFAARRVEKSAESAYLMLARRVTTDWVLNNDHYVFLDVGTGPGRLLVEVKTLFPQVRVMGIDPSAYMLDVARQNAETAGFTDVEIMLGGAEEIPVDSETVDLVVARCSLLFWDDPKKGLSEIYRVLKPDGKVVILDWNKGYSKWKFYLQNLKLMRREGWARAKDNRSSFRRAYPFEKVLQLVLDGSFEPIETEGKELRFFIKAVKAK